MKRNPRIQSFLLMIILATGLAGAKEPTTQPDLKSLTNAQDRSIAVAERIRAATVGIINARLGGPGNMAQGSGVVVSEDGLILTAGHVLGRGHPNLTIVFPDGRSVNATALGADFDLDIGMARITDPGKWPHVEMGRIEDVAVGQWCIAIGHPGGFQVHRTPPLRLGRIIGLRQNSPMRSIISDATVISGDSGGPLFDLDGKLIGIHSSIGLDEIENCHAPIDVYRDKWQDLLAGKQTGETKEKASVKSHISAGSNPATRKSAESSPHQVQADKSGVMAELLKYGKMDREGRLALNITPQNATEVSRLLKKLKMGGMLDNAYNSKVGKANPEFLEGLTPVVATAARSTVSVLCDGQPTLLGTVVRKDGCIVTKASELHGKISCKIGDRELPARLVNQRQDFDLALLKVDADDLTPIVWSEGNLPLGGWLVAADSAGKPLGIGMLGITPRPIPKSPVTILPRKVMIGAMIDHQGNTPLIQAIVPAGPADKAGLHKGDLIMAIDGQPTTRATELAVIIETHKPGDKVVFDTKRDGKILNIPVELAASDQVAMHTQSKMDETLSYLSSITGTLSKRKSDFPIAMTHDIVLQAAHCGGPVVDLAGRAIGLNIARVDRTASYAIPATTIATVITDLLVATEKSKTK